MQLHVPEKNISSNFVLKFFRPSVRQTDSGLKTHYNT